MIHFSLILKNIARHISLNKEETDYFTSLLQPRKIAKKSFLLKEGEACQSLYYVQSGALRAFHLDRRNKESTIMFAINDWWITDMYCFVTEQPAMQSIVAIEDSSVLELKKDELEALFIKVPKFERFFRIIMQNSYAREQLRVLQNLTLTAEERYNIFINKYPQFIPHISQKQIASYLGVTPEFLCTVVKNMTRGFVS